MNSLLKAIQQTQSNVAYTENGMPALKSSGSACVDLFYKVGAMRRQDILPLFTAAAHENLEVAIRIMLWSRDVRGGAGERQHFRNVIRALAVADSALAMRVVRKIPELGRWDDVLSVLHTPAEYVVSAMVGDALAAGDGLCAKWMPREASARRADAKRLMNLLGMKPKEYRQTLAKLSDTVEDRMCSRNWEAIDYSKLPSIASARYQSAFGRNDSERYSAYIKALQKGEKGVKINAGAIYPHDIIVAMKRGNSDVANAQWDALPDFVPEGKSFLPVVDLSGSMGCPATASSSCMDVAIALGLYLSERNKGAFKDAFITFSEIPYLEYVTGDLETRYYAMRRSHIGYSTDFEKVLRLLLDSAVAGNVPQEEMPDTLVMLSDMQFNQGVSNGSLGAYDMMVKMYADAGYTAPGVVYWNLRAGANAPVNASQYGAAMVSGFSPAIMESVLSAEDYTPMGVMMETISDSRYDF